MSTTNQSRKRKHSEIVRFHDNKGTCSLCLTDKPIEELIFCLLDNYGTIGFRCQECHQNLNSD